MSLAPPRQTDPLPWCWAIALAFGALAAWHLGTPGKIYFDEVHYVPAARRLLQGLPANPEHPLLAKEAIAAAIALLGDRPAVWRLPSLLCGTLGLFAFGRALWWASGRRFATLAGMVLLASDFAWFVQARVAMLDMVMAGLAMVAVWQAAVLLAEGPVWRQRLACALVGLCLALALAAKWSVLPVAGLVVGGLLGWRGWAALRGARQRPAPGLRLAEMALWLVSLPLAVYWASFIPAFEYREMAVNPFGMVAWHRYMVDLQASVVKHHPYQSQWWQWVIDWRPIWYLYEPVDGAQRGILLLGNPLTMLVGLPALGWAVLAGTRAARGGAALYAASLGLWVVAHKPVQFYYHYLLPGSFLMAVLALALDALWAGRGAARWAALAVPVASLALMGWFYPIIAAAPLAGGQMAFEHWMWLDSWR